MQVMAVNASLTAAERARIAISTSWSIAKTGSCMSVRWGPVTWARASAIATWSAASGGQIEASGRPATMKCPGL